MNNKCLIRQGYHNSGEPITVVTELKRYVRNRFSVSRELWVVVMFYGIHMVLVHDGFELTDLKVA